MVAILSNHEASLMCFSLLSYSLRRLKATLYMKDKEKWRIFIPAAITPSAQAQY